MTSPIPGYFMVGIGLVMIGITFFWLYGVGYYDRELPVIVVLGLGGAALAWGGQRVFQASKRKRVEQQITERDHQRGL